MLLLLRNDDIVIRQYYFDKNYFYSFRLNFIIFIEYLKSILKELSIDNLQISASALAPISPMLLDLCINEIKIDQKIILFK